MPFPRPEVDIHAPPSDLDDLIEWFDRVSYRLVLLEEYPPSDLEAAVARLDEAVRTHIASTESELGPVGGRDRSRGELRDLLAADHARFPVSLDQLRWSLRRVVEDDLSGHGQALGQYGRVLTEALRRHREDERRALEPRTGSVPPAPRPRREKP